MPHKSIQELLKHKSGAELPASVKDCLAGREKDLRSEHLSSRAGAPVCRAYTAVIDDILKVIYGMNTSGLTDAPTALIAIGGYGRGELNVRSDIDLMLLYGKKLTPGIEELNKTLLYILWDTGLDLGFSIRSIDECVSLARDDLKTMTSLLDRRFLAGDSSLYAELERNIGKKLFSKGFITAFINDKMEESRVRRQRYGGSVYILEPNVKEGEGGLRDFHTALWVVKAKTGDISPGLTPRLITEEDLAKLGASLDFLLWVRNELHFETNRKTDQMSFDHQERIAALLGFKSTEHVLAVESFMQRYYRHASAVCHFSDLIISRCLHTARRRAFLWPRKKVRIDKDCVITDGALHIKGKEALAADPAAAMRAFEYSESFSVEIDQATKDMILEFLDGADDGFRSSRAVAESFLKILKGKDVYRTLTEMNRLRFLEKYIPEFGEISCRTQHDLYHVYTVDTHTLFAIREIERLRDEYKNDFSLLSSIFVELANPHILMLAVLFHDIGKAHGKGHAEKGASIVPDICRRMGLPQDDADMVRFLVKNHLLLADTAQYRDLHDEKLIIDFAKQVGDTERLNLLYLLTFADVRAVGPDVWSQWKGALFQELYFKALTVLERGTFEIEEAHTKILAIRDKVTALLSSVGIGKDPVNEYFKLLPQRYFLSTSPDFIAEHIRILRDMGNKPCVMHVRQDTNREYTEIIVCTHDIHGLFSRITGVMAANGVNILGARINTLKNGLVLDILQVNSPSAELITDEAKIKKIEADLFQVITGAVKIETLVGKRKRPSILDKKAKPRVPTRIQIDNEVSDAYTVIDIHTQNRIGLLYDITSTMSMLGLYIHISKISTKGDEAADIFYVKDIFGQKIYYKEKLQEIIDTLYNVLTNGPEAEAQKHNVNH